MQIYDKITVNLYRFDDIVFVVQISQNYEAF
jgi:hypothetical protein